MHCHSSCTLCCFTVRGRVNICVVVVIFVAAIIIILVVLPIRGSVGGIVGVIPRYVIILKEQALVSVSDAKSPWVAACKAMHAIGYILRKGGRSKALLFQFSPGGEAHEEMCPLAIAGWIRAIAPVTSYCILLSWASCTCAYSPNWRQQCLL